MMMSRSRVVSVFLVAVLIALVGCSISAFRADAAIFRVALGSRHEQYICFNLGTIVIEQTPYPLPGAVALSDAQTYAIRFLNPTGCDFVSWEPTGSVAIRDKKNPVSVLTVTGEGTVTVVYNGICCRSVGGVVPTNTYMALAPYLALVGLVATTIYIVDKKRRR